MTETHPVRHSFVYSGDLRLHRLDFGGSGRPLVCIHGVTGHASLWHDVTAGLTSLRRVVAVDMRGHGDSQWSVDRAYRTDDHATDLEAVVHDLGHTQVDLAGLSWGALVALAFASRHPDRVGRLAMVDVEPSFEQGETDVFPRPREFEDHAAAAAWVRETNPNAPDGMVEVVAGMGTRPGPNGALIPKHDPFFFERWPFRSDDRWDELRALSLPVLVVRADQTWVRAEVAERMATEAPDGRLVQIANSTHLIPVEQPAELGRALMTFFAEETDPKG